MHSAFSELREGPEWLKARHFGSWRSGPFLLPAACYGSNTAGDVFVMYIEKSEQAGVEPAAAVAQMSAAGGV